MDVLRIPSVSLVYVKSQITAKVSGVVIDPTADPVKVAFTATGVTPQTTDFKTGSWETDATATPNRFYARCLVGPGGTVQLTAGLYHMWVQVTDNPEIAVLLAGIVKVI